MSRKRWYVSFIIVICAFNLIILSINKSLKVELKSMEDSERRKNYKFKTCIENKKELLSMLFIDANYQKIIDESMFINRSYYKQIEDIEFPILALRISEKNCSSCVDSLISVYEGMVRSYSGKCIILAEFSLNRDFLIFKNKYNLNNRIYNLKHGLNIDIDSMNVPYFIVMNKRFEVDHVFFPDRYDLNLTREYLEIFKNKYD